jgi:hypothetical protein
MHESGRSGVLTVLHDCGHLQAYSIPGGLGEDARRRVDSRLAEQGCSDCILKGAWKRLPTAQIRVSPAV